MKKILVGITVCILGILFVACHNVVAQDEIPNEINITIPEELPAFTDTQIIKISAFKSYMGHTSIAGSSLPQGKLQKICTTDNDGFRRCNDRYVIAVGSGVGGKVGDCVDLLLQNGNIICCVIGDIKADKHTDAANLTGKNGCSSEFIVDLSKLRKDIKLRGNVSCGYAGWDSPVLVIRKYNTNLLGGI